MYTKEQLLNQITEMNIDPKGTILIHSSMKAIGDVENGADAVLDAFTDYMKEGLLVFPTHTWATIGEDNPTFYVNETPSHIGVLTELFRKRPDVVRSFHPTHSVAALGTDAKVFTADNETFDTPAARGSSWGKLLDRKAKILLIGVDLTRNTYIHGVEEWNDIPGRLLDEPQELSTILPDGTKIQVHSKRHIPGFSEYYWKVEELLAEKGAIEYAQLGDATVLICDAVLLNKYISQMLQIDPSIFSDNKPLSQEFTVKFRELN